MITRTNVWMIATVLGLSALPFCVTPASAITESHSGKALALFAEYPSTVGTGTYTATILKGKKKNMLVIETSMSVLGGATYACIDEVRVNGRLASPNTGSFNVACTGNTTEMMSQAVASVYWFDIDAAETASPGSYYGVPLNVVVKTSTDVSGLVGGVSVVVRMEKK